MAAGGKTALTILGYAACPSQTWDRLVEEVVREGGGSHTLEFFFAETPLKAVTSSIKLAARKLGLSLSATIPSSAKKFPNMGRQVILWSFPISRSSSWPHLSMCPQSWQLGKSELRMGSTVLFAMSLKLVWWAPSKTQRIGLWK